MALYDKISNLKVKIDGYELLPLQQTIPGGHTRHTTIIKFHGEGCEGTGEDVTYGDKEQLDFQRNGQSLKFNSRCTLDEFSKELDEKTLFSIELKHHQEAFYKYRRWAFESAALSLALKQNKFTLADILEIKSKPATFVASLRIDKETGLAPVKQRLERNPDLHFKLDPLPEWTDELIAEIAELGVVDVLDLKGHYKGTSVDVVTNPQLYRKLISAFPEAVIEDPDITDETMDILRPESSRISWDAPIHSIEDFQRMPLGTKWLNIKPSRFGSINALFDMYDYCREHDVKMYGGGQFELGQGRNQIQHLAALFHPDAPNDIAPAEYNADPLPGRLPKSPVLAPYF